MIKGSTFLYFLGIVGLLSTPFPVLGQDFSTTQMDSSLSEISQLKTEYLKSKGYEQLIIQIHSQPQDVKLSLYAHARSKDSTDLAIKMFTNGYVEALKEQGNITEAVEVYKEIIWKYIDLGNDAALYFADQSIALARENNYALGVVISLEAKGLYYEIVEGNLDKASALYYEAVNLCEQHKLPYKADIYHTLGVMFHISDRFDKGKTYYELAYALAIKNNNVELQKKCLINLGSVYSSLKDYEKAENFLLQSIAIPLRPELDYDTYANLGNLYLRQHEYSKALQFLEKATKKYPDNTDADINLRFLIDAKTKLKDTTGMQDILQRAESTLETSKIIREKSLMIRSISNYFREIGEFEKALNYRDAYLDIYSEILENQRDEIVYELEAKYQSEKINAALAKKEKQRQFLLFGVIVLFAVLIALFVFYKKRLKYQNTIALQREKLQKQQITELQQKNKLVAMSSMIEGQEAERLRIAKDLHDGLGGVLSAIKGVFTTIQNDGVPEEKNHLYDKTNALIDTACIEVRRISHNMIPHALHISGLEWALSDLGDLLRQENLEVTVEIGEIPKALDETKILTIYRLAQELLNNIRKHARATQVLIQLLTFEKSMTFIIEDNGIGFDLEKAKQTKGVGLKSIFSRVEFLDGVIDYDTKPNLGTTVTIEIPIS